MFEDDSRNSGLRTMALQGLFQTERPTVKTAHAVAALIERDPSGPLASSALLALGSVVGGLDSTEQAPALARLERLARQQSDRGFLSTYLGALGNTGLEAVTTMIQPFVSSSEAGLREQAMAALARIPGREASRLLGRALASDPDETVRTEALKAISRRTEPEALTNLARALAEDRSDEIRLRALTLVGERASSSPVARSLVLHAANDASPAVSRRAREIKEGRR
jgi:HEAT repeat protein